MAMTYLYDESGSSKVNYEKKIKGKEKVYYDTSNNYTNGCENEKEELVKQNKEKANEVLKLRNELYSLQAAMKMKDDKLNEYKEKLRKVIQQFKTREGELILLNKANEKRLNEMIYSHNPYMKENESNRTGTSNSNNNKEDNMCSYNKPNNNHYDHTYDCSYRIEEAKTIKSLQTTIEELKKENKQIEVLTKMLDVKDTVINESYAQIEKLKKKNDKLKVCCNNNNSAQYPISNKQANFQKSHSERITNDNVFVNIQNHKAQFEKKDALYNDLNYNYNSLLRENEQLIQYTLSQTKQIENTLDLNEIYPINNKSFSFNDQLPEVNDKKYSPINSHYALLAKTFEIIHKKLINKLNINSSIIDQLKEHLSEEDERNKSKQNIMDQLIKENAIQEEKINQLNEDINTKSITFDEIDKKYNELFSRCRKIEDVLNNSNDKYTQFQLETDEFCNSCIRVIENYLHIDPYNESIKAKEDKILESLLVLCHSIPQSNNSNNNGINNQSEINTNRNDKSNRSFNNEEANSKIHLDNETIRNQIKALTTRIDESNLALQCFEEETSLLKSKNSKLEHNIAMLTQSHSKMEQAIELNTEYYKELLKEKEVKNINLLKETELKDIQIHSLEKLIKEMHKVNNLNEISDPNMHNQSHAIPYNNHQMRGRLVSKSQVNEIRLKKNDDNFNMNNTNTNTIFVPNEENEKELKSIFQRFDQESSTQRGDYCYNSNDSINMNNHLINNGTPCSKDDNSLRYSPSSNLYNDIKDCYSQQR